MARGKHARSAAKRHAEKEATEIVSLRSELAEVNLETASLRRRIVDQDTLRKEITRLRAQADAGSSDALDKELGRSTALLARVSELEATIEKWDRRYSDFMTCACAALGGGGQSMADLFSLWDKDFPRLYTDSPRAYEKGVLDANHLRVIEWKNASLKQNLVTRARTLARLTEAFPEEMAAIHMPAVVPFRGERIGDELTVTVEVRP